MFWHENKCLCLTDIFPLFLQVRICCLLSYQRPCHRWLDPPSGLCSTSSCTSRLPWAIRYATHFSQILRIWFLHLGTHHLVAYIWAPKWFKLLKAGLGDHSTPLTWSKWQAKRRLLMKKLTFQFSLTRLCLWRVWPPMSATCCRATYGSGLPESYWSWQFAACVYFWGCWSSQR